MSKDPNEIRLAELETHLQYLARREDIVRVEKVIAEKESSMMRWLITVLITLVLGMAGILVAVWRALGQGSQ